MRKKNNKKKRIKREQKERRKFNKENKIEHIISYVDYIQHIINQNLESEEWLIMESQTKKQIKYVLNNLKPLDILVMESKFSEALIALIHCCEELYSPFIYKNLELQKEACITLVNYYRSSFEIRYSSEISILPLELRLYIYIEMLKREASKYNIVNILDRISVTLNKMQKEKAYNAGIFMLTWAEIILFITTDVTHYYENFHYSYFSKCRKDAFSGLMMQNYMAINPVRGVRERILKEEAITALDCVSKEFWYGVNLFSKKDKINNITVAKICLHLFCIYFERIFTFSKEFERIIIDYYDRKENKAVQNFINEHKYDELILSELRSIYTVEIKAVESKNPWEYKDQKYLFINDSANREIKLLDANKLPQSISPSEYSKLICDFLKLFENGGTFLFRM